MNLFTGFMVFVIIWWLVLFCILPIGIRPPEAVEKGHADGAPANPKIWLRFLVTTGITIVLWGVAFYVIESGWFDPRTF